MKKLSKIFTMTLSLLLLAAGCEEDTSLTSDNITDDQWKLVTIQMTNETIIISESSYVSASSYILVFHDSTNFSLNTSVNTARGNYELRGDTIKVRNYQELSEVATNDSEQQLINEYLLSNFTKVNKYSLDENNLTFHIDNEELLFERITP